MGGHLIDCCTIIAYKMSSTTLASSCQAEWEKLQEMDILSSYPEYATTTHLDRLRATEYGYLDEQDHVYLDFTGAGLASRSQYRHQNERLSHNVYGNPHSLSPSSQAATEAVEVTRGKILKHFQASNDEYTVVFTPNATGAARLVADGYAFHRGQRLVLTSDNHNSVNGIREMAKDAGVKTVYVPATEPDLRIKTSHIVKALNDRSNFRCTARKMLGSCFGFAYDDDPQSASDVPASLTCKGQGNLPSVSHLEARAARYRKHSSHTKGLFAFPAQSNFHGIRHPLSWVAMAQEAGYDVLLDAAAYAPTSRLDLSVVKPEFVLVSWYKVFGYPTGVGCLIAKRKALERLKRPWFAGGTVQIVGVGVQWHALADHLEARFEDGTVNFLSIPDVGYGLDWYNNALGQESVATRTRCLTGWFIDRLQSLKHSDGSPLATVYGPVGTEMRGGTVAFNFINSHGEIVDERLVALESAKAGISVRTGCFCNPGAGEAAFRVKMTRLAMLWHADTTNLDDYIKILKLPSGGSVRVSFGPVSTVGDVERFLSWAESTYRDRVTSSKGLAPREAC
jgi:selenocysteine lyase/cysteine desulfurase